MSDLQEHVAAALGAQRAPADVLTLWRDIFSWYTDGGPTLIEENLYKKISEITSKFAKSAREIQAQKIKKPRRTRKRSTG